MVGAGRLARPRLPDSESGGSAVPREPRAGEIGVPDRLRSGDLLHERQACWLGYTTGTEMVRAGDSLLRSDASAHPLWLAELMLLKLVGAGMVSPAGLSPATWSLGHSRSVL